MCRRNRQFILFLLFSIIKSMYIDYYKCTCRSVQMFRSSERQFVWIHIRCNYGLNREHSNVDVCWCWVDVCVMLVSVDLLWSECAFERVIFVSFWISSWKGCKQEFDLFVRFFVWWNCFRTKLFRMKLYFDLRVIEF